MAADARDIHRMHERTTLHDTNCNPARLDFEINVTGSGSESRELKLCAIKRAQRNSLVTCFKKTIKSRVHCSRVRLESRVQGLRGFFECFDFYSVAGLSIARRNWG